MGVKLEETPYREDIDKLVEPQSSGSFQCKVDIVKKFLGSMEGSSLENYSEILGFQEILESFKKVSKYYKDQNTSIYDYEGDGWKEVQTAIFEGMEDVLSKNQGLYIDGKEEIFDDVVDYLIESLSNVNYIVVPQINRALLGLYNKKEFLQRRDLVNFVNKRLLESITDRRNFKYMFLNRYLDLFTDSDKGILSTFSFVEEDKRELCKQAISTFINRYKRVNPNSFMLGISVADQEDNEKIDNILCELLNPGIIELDKEFGEWVIESICEDLKNQNPRLKVLEKMVQPDLKLEDQDLINTVINSIIEVYPYDGSANKFLDSIFEHLPKKDEIIFDKTAREFLESHGNKNLGNLFFNKHMRQDMLLIIKRRFLKKKFLEKGENSELVADVLISILKVNPDEEEKKEIFDILNTKIFTNKTWTIDEQMYSRILRNLLWHFEKPEIVSSISSFLKERLSTQKNYLPLKGKNCERLKYELSLIVELRKNYYPEKSALGKEITQYLRKVSNIDNEGKDNEFLNIIKEGIKK